MLSKNQAKHGFTIIELLITVFVLSIGLAGVMVLISQLFFYSGFASSKLTAVYLCQEGMEIVRNIRDSNWLSGLAWNQGLDSGAWEAEYTSVSLSPWIGSGRGLRLNGAFYNYTNGGETKFKRRIDINRPGNDEIQVTVAVMWSERGRKHEIRVSESLYNWNP